MRTAALLLITFGVLSAQDKIAPGTYKGTWAGASAGGDIHLTLKADGSGGFTGEIGFTLEGQEIPGKITLIKVDGTNLILNYEFDVQGNKLQSATVGTLHGKTLEGTYKTTAEDTAIDQGT